MWKNSVQPDKPQTTILCVRFVCWISEATHTHTHRIFNTYCFQGNNGYANAPQCYVIRKYITCIVKDTSVQKTAPLRQTYPVQFRTVPCPRQDGISSLSYPPPVPSLCSRRHNSRSFYNLKSTSEWMWAPLLGPQTVIWGFMLFMGSHSAVSRLDEQQGLNFYQERRFSLHHIYKICGIYTPLLSDRLWFRFS